jgi:hypothetical protein
MNALIFVVLALVGSGADRPVTDAAVDCSARTFDGYRMGMTIEEASLVRRAVVGEAGLLRVREKGEEVSLLKVREEGRMQGVLRFAPDGRLIQVDETLDGAQPEALTEEISSRFGAVSKENHSDPALEGGSKLARAVWEDAACHQRVELQITYSASGSPVRATVSLTNLTP